MYRIIKIRRNYCGDMQTPELMKGKYKSEVSCLESICELVTDYSRGEYIQPLDDGGYIAYYIIKD